MHTINTLQFELRLSSAGHLGGTWVLDMFISACFCPPMCMQMWSKNKDPVDLPPWCCRHHLRQTPTKYIQGGLCLVIVGARWLVHLGQSSDQERLERLRPNEGKRYPVEKWYREADLHSVGRRILPTCSCKLLRSLYPPQRKTLPKDHSPNNHIYTLYTTGWD